MPGLGESQYTAGPARVTARTTVTDSERAVLLLFQLEWQV